MKEIINNKLENYVKYEINVNHVKKRVQTIMRSKYTIQKICVP